MVYFPHEETGKAKKLSQSCHGTYWTSKVYFAQYGQIQVHQSRVKSCPPHIPCGFYWYGGQHQKPGIPTQVDCSRYIRVLSTASSVAIPES